jgi:diguanylate cyclase (GGDEF)-like protein
MLDILLFLRNNISMSTAIVDSTLIQKQELFANLTREEIDFVVSRSGTLKLSRGTPLFTPGEQAKQFYILKEGAIRVYKNRDDGGEDEMARFTPGDTIGDFDFARGAEYDACAEATEDSFLVEFPGYGYTINSLSNERPHTVCNILLNAIVLMTGRIKSVNKLILDNMPWVQELHRRAYEDSGTGLWKQTLINDEIIGSLSDPAALIMLKPDRFKILVDSRGHHAGDEAMIRIAIILKNITRKIGHGWPLRFKSNEVGIIINNCSTSEAEEIVTELAEIICEMDPVPPHGDFPEFHFSTTISWAIWAKDNADWESFFQGNYTSLLDAWKAGGNRIVHYSNTGKK